MVDDLGLVRQLGQHLLLEAAQDEGADHRPQQRHVLGILDRLAEAALELAEAAEQARVDEGEQAPQLPQVVLDGGAGEGQAKIPLELEQQLGTLGAGILDLLRLVQHHARPAAGLEGLGQAAEHAVVDQDDLAGLGLLDQGLPLGGVLEHHHLQLGGEPHHLLLPVGDHGLGYHHQRGAEVLAHAQHHERLQRLAKAHVIGETGAEAMVGQGRHPAHPVLLIVPQRRQEFGGTLHLLLPLLLQGVPGIIPGRGHRRQQAGQGVGQLVVDALLGVQHGPQHGEALHQLVAQHQAGLLIELNGALARGQLAQDEAQVEDLVFVQCQCPLHLEPVLATLDAQAQGRLVEALETGAVLMPVNDHSGVHQLGQRIDQGQCLLTVQLPFVARQADGQLVAQQLGLGLLGSQIPLPVVIVPDALAHYGLPLAKGQRRQLPLPGHQLDQQLTILPVQLDRGHSGPGGQLGIAAEPLDLAVPGQLGNGVQGTLQLGEPVRRQQRDGFQRRESVQQGLRGQDELPQILGQGHYVRPSRRSGRAQDGAHALLGGDHLQQGGADGQLQLLPLGVEQARMAGQGGPGLTGQLAHAPWQGAHQGPVRLVEQGGILGGEQGRIDPAPGGPLPLGALLLDLALELRPFRMKQPYQPLLRLAHAAGAPQPLQPIEPAGRGGGLVLILSVAGRIESRSGTQLLQRGTLGSLPQQEAQQILTESHQAMTGLGLQHMGEIPLVQYGHLGALLAVAREGAEIQPEVAPVELLQRQLQSIEQAYRLTVTITGPLSQQIRKQGEMVAKAALPLLALLAGEHGIGLLQPAKPEQGAEHPGPGLVRRHCLPLSQRAEQPLRQGLFIPPLGQLLQGRPVSDHLAGQRAAEPLPLAGQRLEPACQRGGAGRGHGRQRPVRFGLGIEQGLQG